MNETLIIILTMVALYSLLKGIQYVKSQNNEINTLWNGDISNEEID